MRFVDKEKNIENLQNYPKKNIENGAVAIQCHHITFQFELYYVIIQLLIRLVSEENMFPAVMS